MNGQPPRPASPAAERRLDEHLALLRTSGSEPADTARAGRVVRTARAQQLVRAPLQVAGMIAAGMLHGIAGLLGVHRRSR